MTPKTQAMYADTCEKVAMAVTAVEIGICDPIDLLSQAEMHLLLMESFERLCAVIVEGTGCAVEWVNGRAP